MAVSLPVLRALDTGVSFAVFSQEGQHYIEINIEIAAASVTFKSVDSIHLQAGVETLIMIKQGEKIVNFEKYLLKSPLTERPVALLDVKRMALDNGNYILDIQFADQYDHSNRSQFRKNFEVSIEPAKIYLTEPVLLRHFKKSDDVEHPFVKNGYLLEPLPFNFYDRTATRLAYYAEIYHADRAGVGEYVVRTVVEQQLGNQLSRLVSVGNQKKKASSIDAVLIQMDISTLESGNYTLTVELRNREGELLQVRRTEFQRSNPFRSLELNQWNDSLMSVQFTQNLDEEILRYAARAAAVLVSNDEAEMVKQMLKNSDPKPLRLFLFNFFIRRNANNPELEYHKYMETARAADRLYKSGFRLGFETDRGRTYMRFGRPDDLVHVEDDPAAPPYEIWIYYNFPKTKQTNVKFLFYNPSLAGEDYILLHSNARGEINNPRWERELYRRHAYNQQLGENYHDAVEMQGNFNRNARRYFEDF